jgi:hypothetical protein
MVLFPAHEWHCGLMFFHNAEVINLAAASFV